MSEAPNLSRYLARIGYTGPTAPTLSVLRGVHRHHALAIPYENLDVLQQVPVDQDLRRIYNKIVVQRRGGWCYEMNGLLGWALAGLGFRVTRQIGGVMRQARGDDAFGNHLVLRVAIDGGNYIADVGLGDAIVEPVPLVAGQYHQGHRRFRLEDLGDNVWRFHNTEGAMPPSFDFRLRPELTGFDADPADEGQIAETCRQLQEDEESMFRQNLICELMSESGVKVLLGRVLTENGKRTLLGYAAELAAALRTFGLPEIDCDRLWLKVLERHSALFGDTPVDQIQFGPPPSEEQV